MLLTQIVYLYFSHVPKMSDSAVGKSHSFCLAQQSDITDMSGELLLCFYDAVNTVDKKQIYTGSSRNLFTAASQTQQLSNGADAVVGCGADIFQKFALMHFVKFAAVKVVKSGFERADAFQQTFFKGTPDAHHLSGGLHLGTQRVVGIGKLVKRKSRKLGDNIIQRRLKGSGCIGKGDLI